MRSLLKSNLGVPSKASAPLLRQSLAVIPQGLPTGTPSRAHHSGQLSERRYKESWSKMRNLSRHPISSSLQMLRLPELGAPADPRRHVVARVRDGQSAIIRHRQKTRGRRVQQ
jgi:hypothetical protein